MACYTLTTCGGVNPYYSFESTDPLLAPLVGQSVRLIDIIPDSGTGSNMPDGMCWTVEETGTCSTTYSLTILGTPYALCTSCGPSNFIKVQLCGAVGPIIMMGFIGSPLPSPTPLPGDVVIFNSLIPTPGCTVLPDTCYSVVLSGSPPSDPVCWTEDWQVVDALCVVCEECVSHSITAELDIKEGCKDVFVKVTAVGWDTTTVVTSGIFLTVDGVKYDISAYAADIFNPGVTLTFDEQFTDGVHCWEIEIINTDYCDYKTDFCELSLCQACCKLKTLAAKLLKDCDRCSNKFKEKFLEAYAIYKALQLAGICGNEEAITKGLKTLNALLDELGCKDCKNC
ncbi:MAG: hypothetical protein ABGY11_09110 [Candidatus Thioglobus sp.]